MRIQKISNIDIISGGVVTFSNRKNNITNNSELSKLLLNIDQGLVQCLNVMKNYYTNRNKLQHLKDKFNDVIDFIDLLDYYNIQIPINSYSIILKTNEIKKFYQDNMSLFDSEASQKINVTIELIEQNFVYNS